MRMSISFAAVLVAVCCASSAFAQEAVEPASCNLRAAPGVSDRQLTSGGTERSYPLFVPPSYDGSTRLPLVLDLHGSGGTAARQASNSRFEALAARAGFLVASLQAAGSGNRWNVPVTDERPDDVAYVSDVDGLKHEWAHRQVDATAVMWAFFSRHSLHESY